mmetsp:Transcript_45693/g.52650  ORF Transcript_45693/g.52650 Transcript_45693/m.52650 type:complete len:542 (+) Transcript_45693:42-1667(+)
MEAPVRSNFSELEKKLKSFVCCCEREGHIVGYCTDDHVFVCKDCLMDHSSHLELLKTISDYDSGLTLLKQTLKQPKCAKHSTETQGFYCFDEKSFVCLQCRSNCESSGHNTEFFEHVLNQRLEEFREICIKIDEVSLSTQEALDKSKTIQLETINEMFNRLIETIEKKRSQALKNYEESFEKFSADHGVFTTSLHREWQNYKGKLEEAKYCDFISQTCEGTLLETVKKQMKEDGPLIGSSKALPTLRRPSQDCLNLTFLDDLISTPSTQSQAFVVHRDSKNLLQRSPTSQESFKIPSHLLAADNKFYYPPSITTNSNKSMIYISGGRHTNYTYSNQLLSFNTSSHTWKQVSKLPLGMYGHGFTCSPGGDKLYVIGGYDGGSNCVRQCWSYDLDGDLWVELGDLECSMSGGSCFCYGDREEYCVVYCSVLGASGNGGVYVFNVSMKGEALERFGAGTWRRVDDMELGATGETLQTFRWANDSAIILCKNGSLWNLKLGKKLTLEKLKMNKQMFWTKAGFYLDKATIGVLGDEGQWNLIKMGD